MLNALISPSLMCADLLDLGNALRAIESAGAQLLHIDIMDGHFVPNYTLGPDFVRAVRRGSALPLDMHLMVERPEEAVGRFEFKAGDMVSAHPESTPHIDRALRLIADKGALPGVAINPGTPVQAIEPLLDVLEFVVVMTVNPGFAGQKLIPYTLGKIARVRRMLDEAGMANKRVQVDGNVSFENAPLMREMGADVFVAGTSSVFRSDLGIAQGLRMLREAIGA